MKIEFQLLVPSPRNWYWKPCFKREFIPWPIYQVHWLCFLICVVRGGRSVSLELTLSW